MKTSTVKGTRDFFGDEYSKRAYIREIIENAFKVFGFHPLETPAFEHLSTLTEKYGEEGDQLIFKILKSGDFLSQVDDTVYQQKQYKDIVSSISDKALKYDLTVPFARFVAQNHGQLTYPLKRYQIQPVWRADRPQKGRYREFYQCDADIVGSDSLWNEVELIQLYDAVFAELQLDVTIAFNNRKILMAIVDYVEISDQYVPFTVILDKWDKIGKDKVREEVVALGVQASKWSEIEALFNSELSTNQLLEALLPIVKDSEIGKKGLEEIQFIVSSLPQIKAVLTLDLTLARGLNYYTGTILEVKSNQVELGSIGGGGRYDNLTEIFGLKGISGVGISFGLDRIEWVLEETKGFPKVLEQAHGALFFYFSDSEAQAAQTLISDLHKAGKRVALYPENAKIGKQFQYAENNNYLWAVFYGQKEIEQGKVSVKNLQTGEQLELTLQELTQTI